MSTQLGPAELASDDEDVAQYLIDALQSDVPDEMSAEVYWSGSLPPSESTLEPQPQPQPEPGWVPEGDAVDEAADGIVAARTDWPQPEGLRGPPEDDALTDNPAAGWPITYWDTLTTDQQRAIIMADIDGELCSSPVNPKPPTPELLQLPQPVLLLIMSSLHARDLVMLGRASADVWRAGVWITGVSLLQEGARMAVERLRWGGEIDLPRSFSWEEASMLGVLPLEVLWALERAPISNTHRAWREVGAERVMLGGVHTAEFRVYRPYVLGNGNAPAYVGIIEEPNGDNCDEGNTHAPREWTLDVSTGEFVSKIGEEKTLEQRVWAGDFDRLVVGHPNTLVVSLQLDLRNTPVLRVIIDDSVVGECHLARRESESSLELQAEPEQVDTPWSGQSIVETIISGGRTHAQRLKDRTESVGYRWFTGVVGSRPEWVSIRIVDESQSTQPLMATNQEEPGRISRKLSFCGQMGFDSEIDSARADAQRLMDAVCKGDGLFSAVSGKGGATWVGDSAEDEENAASTAEAAVTSGEVRAKVHAAVFAAGLAAVATVAKAEGALQATSQPEPESESEPEPEPQPEPDLAGQQLDEVRDWRQQADGVDALVSLLPLPFTESFGTMMSSQKIQWILGQQDGVPADEGTLGTDAAAQPVTSTVRLPDEIPDPAATVNVERVAQCASGDEFEAWLKQLWPLKPYLRPAAS